MILIIVDGQFPIPSSFWWREKDREHTCLCVNEWVCMSALNFIYNLLFIITFSFMPLFTVCFCCWCCVCISVFSHSFTIRFLLGIFFSFCYCWCCFISFRLNHPSSDWYRMRFTQNKTKTTIPTKKKNRKLQPNCYIWRVSHNLVFRVISNFNFRLRFDTTNERTKYTIRRKKEGERNEKEWMETMNDAYSHKHLLLIIQTGSTSTQHNLTRSQTHKTFRQTITITTITTTTAMPYHKW